MPLTEKGKEIKSAMESEYGKGKGEQVFYASKNKGTISGVDDVPEVGYRMTIPSGSSLEQLNAANQEAWAGKSGTGRSSGTEGGQNMSMLPQVNKSNFNQGAGLAGRSSRDEKEFPETPEKSPLGEGQNPHEYLQPRDEKGTVPGRGEAPKANEGPGIKEGAKMAGAHPPSSVKEYQTAGPKSIASMNEANEKFWNKNNEFKGR